MKYCYFLAGTLLLFSACRKNEIPVAPAFDATAAAVEYRVGDTVKFSLSGNPGIISFYSGDIGNDYDHRTGRVMPVKQFLSFQTQMLGGTQANQLSVLTSTNFNGLYTVADVEAATWNDISSRFRLANSGDASAYINSGKPELTDQLVAGKPLYLAFKYVTLPQNANGIYNIWRVQSFLFEGVNDVASTIISDHANAGWNLVLKGDYEPNRCKINATNLDLRGNLTNKDASTVAWAISKPFSLSSEVDFGPDYAVGIKAVADPALTSYSYTYTRPGDYTVTFIARNVNVWGNEDVMKQIQIKVKP
jgi:hypothetical protein